MENLSNPEQKTLEQIEALSEKLDKLQEEIRGQVFGQEDVIQKTIITLLAGGHALLVGVPGLAKTRLARTLGTAMGLDEKRVQFTPDLMPADILGSEILDKDSTGRQHFRFVKGPVFSQLLMADEINRASPRTQSALLQAMQEKHVTIAGHQYDLPTPFHVLATQNPIEQEGTYPLPEAQLDRFLMRIDIDYPSIETEKQILLETTGNQETPLSQALSSNDLIEAQTLVRDIPVSDQVIEAILKIVHSARPGSSDNPLVRDYVIWGPGPRASQAMILAARARALLQGRFSPSIEDVIYLAPSILGHRMSISYHARAEEISLDGIIQNLLESIR
ncbi:AAA domain-containing protein [Sneathiella sp. P13V-1]|uniref:AAA family ATPase n=1 Tax=Sneathiella sp. P13V-1 TaxID=2697366 RepID=UPI00187BB271|nr:MoxR family ATPase [Sneathiella sp. P13V-1]MBE7635533.1 AAA domain-containing protein [Sneathiella sp. P13V-1]